jgi:hypothetical protein
VIWIVTLAGVAFPAFATFLLSFGALAARRWKRAPASPAAAPPRSRRAAA